MLARKIFSASLLQNDAYNSNIPLTRGNQIAYPVSNAFSVNLSLSWSEYELISLKTKPISYWEQFSFGKTGSPRTMVLDQNFLSQVNEFNKNKGNCGGEAPLYI